MSRSSLRRVLQSLKSPRSRRRRSRDSLRNAVAATASVVTPELLETRMLLSATVAESVEGTFTVDYNEGTDTLTIAATGDRDTFVVQVPTIQRIEQLNGSGPSQTFEFHEVATLYTDAMVETPAFGAVISDTVVRSVDPNDPNISQIVIPNLLTGLVPELVERGTGDFSSSSGVVASTIIVNRFVDSQNLFVAGETGDPPRLNEPQDFFRHSFVDLENAAVAQLPEFALVGQEVKIPFEVPAPEANSGDSRTQAVVFDFGDGSETVRVDLEPGVLQGTVAHTFTQKATVQVKIDSIIGRDTVTGVADLEVLTALPDASFSLAASELLSLAAFDVVAIDDLSRPNDSGIEKDPEVRFGFLQGRVSDDAVNAATAESLTDLRVRVRPSVDVAVPEDEVPDNVFVFDVDVNNEGVFQFHMEEELFRAVGAGPVIQRLSPRLTPRDLTLELLGQDDEIKDTIRLDRETLLELLNRGIVPSTAEFPRVLDVDLQLQDETLSLDGNARLNANILVQNSTLLSRILPSDAVLRVEIDFGDGSPVQGTNVPPEALTSSHRTLQTPEFFRADTELFRNISAQAADRLRRHTYTETGEFEVTVTATLPNGQVSTATRTVTVVSAETAATGLGVNNLQVRSKFRSQLQYSTLITGRLEGFGDNPNPTLRMEIGPDTVTLDITNLTDRGSGRFDFELEFDAQELDLLGLVPDGIELEDAVLNARLSFFDNDNDRIDKIVQFGIQVPELFGAAITGTGRNQSLAFNLDTGVRQGVIEPLIVELTNVRVEITRTEPGEQPVTEFLVENIVAESDSDRVVSELARLAVETHFGGADNVPDDLEIIGLTDDDRQMQVRVFTRRNDLPDDTPSEQLKEELIDEQQFANSVLRSPFLHFKDGLLLSLRDGLETAVEGGSISELFGDFDSSGVRGLNGVRIATLTSPDRSVAFERSGNPNSDDTLSTIGSGRGPNVAARRAGDVTIQIADQNGDPLETIKFNVHRGQVPSAVVPISFTPEEFNPGPLSSEEDRTLELHFVRGEVTGGVNDPITAIVNGLQDNGKLAFNTIQGAGDVRTLTAHLVVIDWGDGTTEEIVVTPEDQVGSRIHTFSSDYLKQLQFVPRFGGAVLEGEIFVTVSELNADLQIVRAGRRQAIRFDGPKALGVIAFNDDTDFEIDDSFSEDLFNDFQNEQRQLTQIRKLIVGDENNVIRLPPGVGTSQQFFEVVVDFGNGEVFRIVRDEGDRFTNTARMFRNAEGTGPEERVVFLQNEIRLVSPDTGESLFNYDEVGKFTIEFSQEADIVIDGLDDPTEQKFGRVEVVVLPKVDVEINGDGSLSGTIVAPVDSLQNKGRVELDVVAPDTPPQTFDLSSTDTIQLSNAFPREFLFPGQRLGVEVFFFGRDGIPTDRFTVNRIITPTPKLNIEDVAISVAGGLTQLAPLDVTVTLGPETLERANNPGPETFTLTISPGGGEADIVLERNAATAAGQFTIEGTDDTVGYNPDTGGIDVSTTGIGGDSRISYRNFGKHTFRVFSECSFGFVSVQIADVLPTVIEPFVLTVDLFGNVQVQGEVEAQNDVEVVVEQEVEDGDEDDRIAPEPKRLFNNRVGPRQGPFDLLFNNQTVKPGNQLNVGIREEEGDQSVVVLEQVTVAKLALNVGVIVDIQDPDRPLLTLDVRELIDAATARAIAAGAASESGNGQASASFTIQVGTDGDLIPASVDVFVTETVSTVVTIGGQRFLADDFIILPITFSKPGSQFVTVSDDDGCITGITEVNVTATANILRNLKAVLHPDGTTEVSGLVPAGSNAETTVIVTTPDGQTFERQVPADDREFRIADVPGAEPGATVTVEIQGGGSDQVDTEAKQTSINVGIKLLGEAGGSAHLVEFDFRKVIAELERQATNDPESDSAAQVLFLISDGSGTKSGTQLFGIVVKQEADGTFTNRIVSLLNPSDEDIIRDGKSILRVQVKETRELFIEDVLTGDVCITGRASFDISDAGEVVGASGPREQIESDGNESAEGSVNVIRDGTTGDTANVNVAPTGGSVTLEDGTEIADGEEQQVVVAVGDDGNEQLNFVFDPNPAADPAQRVRQGEVKFFVVDPDDADNIADISTRFFFVREAGDPCLDHPFFPTATTFAGDVTIALNGIDVLINGDADNNGFSIITDERGIVAVPVSGTTINGAAADFVIFAGVATMPGSMSIADMGDGDDFVCLNGFDITGSLDATMNLGDDVFLSSNVAVTEFIDLLLGEGNDKADLTGTTTDDSAFLEGADGDDRIIGTDSDDELSGDDGTDELDGGEGVDEIVGGLGADIQRGGDGDDSFVWNNGDGPDDNFGGAGDDIFIFNGADGADDQLQLIPGNAAGQGGGDGTHPNPDFKLARTQPSAFTIELSSVENATINGLAGNDTLDASLLTAGVVNVALFGNDGDDVLQGSQGADILGGGDGNDTIVGNRGNDDAFGDLDNPGEFFFGGIAGTGGDLFVWNNGDGADNFDGNTGNDTFRFNGAHGAADNLRIAPAADVGEAGDGDLANATVDLTRTAPSAFSIETAAIENFEVNGFGGDDVLDASLLTAGLLTSLTLNGGNDNDVLRGSAGVDALNGGEGNDTLVGFLGADQQSGDAGDDLFIWNNGDGPDDNFGGQGVDTFRFKGADGASDDLRLAHAADIGEAGDGSHPNANFDLTRILPSAFTIENGGIENAEVNGLGGGDTFNVVLFADVALNLNGGDSDSDSLIVDAEGLAAQQTGDQMQVDGRQPIDFAGFESVEVVNAAVQDELPPSSNVVRPASIFVRTKQFPIEVVGTDSGADASGIATFEIFVRENLRGPFTLLEVVNAVPSEVPGSFEASTTFTGHSNTIYQFFSVAVDNVGNREDSVEGPHTDALIFVSDVDAPQSQVDDVVFNAGSGQFTVDFSGTDVGGRIRFFDVFVAIDGGAATNVGTVHDQTGGSLQVPAINDGVPHDYRFFTVATDRRGNVEAAPTGATDDIVLKDIVFNPAPELEVTDFNVQNNLQQRSFINTLTVTFATEAGIDDLIANAASRIGLFNTGRNGMGNSAIDLSTATFIRNGRSLTVNLGATGLTTDGFHELRLDLNGDGTFDNIQSFHRLQGDSDGDGDVDIVDLLRVRRSLIFRDNNPNSDVTGDGQVNILDLFFAARNFGASLD